MLKKVKPKLVHLVNRLGLDGSSKVVIDLCTSFENDFELHVVTLKKNIENVSLPESVRIHEFNYEEDTDYSMIGYLRNWFDKAAWRKKYRKLIDEVEALNPDLIHCHIQPRELMIINSSKKLSAAKLLYTDHSTRIKPNEYSWLNRQVLAWVYRNIYKKFHVVAVSKSVADYHHLFKIVSKNKLHRLISNKVDTELFAPITKKKSDLLRVIYVARIHPKKGHETLIKAWASLKSAEPCELILVGGSNEADERKIRELVENVQPKFPIVFVGSTNNVLPYLHSSDIAVFPSLNEGLPLSLLEKMSCGLPVIASNIPEFQGIIQDGQNGLFFEMGNPEQLTRNLERLIEDPSLRKKLGENARQFVIENYSGHEFIKAYRDVYGEILNWHNQNGN